jgi:hypothetical protein
VTSFNCRVVGVDATRRQLVIGTRVIRVERSNTDQRFELDCMTTLFVVFRLEQRYNVDDELVSINDRRYVEYAFHYNIDR